MPRSAPRKWRAISAPMRPSSPSPAISNSPSRIKGFAWFGGDRRRPRRAWLAARSRHRRDRQGRPFPGRARSLRTHARQPDARAAQIGSVHASMINGGAEWSSYPSHCRISLERRTVPGESAELVAGSCVKSSTISRSRCLISSTGWSRGCVASRSRSTPMRPSSRCFGGMSSPSADDSRPVGRAVLDGLRDPGAGRHTLRAHRGGWRRRTRGDGVGRYRSVEVLTDILAATAREFCA